MTLAATNNGGVAGALAGAPLISDPAAYLGGVPHVEFARRRRECPVAWVEEKPLMRYGSAGGVEVPGSGYWAVTRYAAVAAASKDPEVFSSGYRGAFLADPKTHQDLERTRQLLINMDAPEHARIRRVVGGAFTPRAIGNLRDGIRRHAQALVDAALVRGEFDVVTDLAAELPGGHVDVYKRTFEEMFAYASDLAATKRQRPGDDLISTLVRGDGGGEALTDAEYRHLFVLLVVAGNETTRQFLSGSLLALIESPQERDRLAARPDLLPSAVEELLRYVSPVMQFRRTAMRDTELDGQEIRAGDKVVLYYISANRDEEAFEAPDRLDLGRGPNPPHLAFGTGPHFCLGAHLAKLEAAILLDTLRPHLAALEVVGPVVRLESNFMNGTKSIPARFARRRRRG
jgi:cytochrome P450